MARENARRLTPRRRHDWLQGDLLTPLRGPLECVVANLPYVPEAAVAGLAPEIRRYEPRAAVTPGTTGVELILRLVTQLGTRLAPGGIAVLEIDPGLAREVSAAARRLLGPAQVDVLNDLAGEPRAVKNRGGVGSSHAASAAAPAAYIRRDEAAPGDRHGNGGHRGPIDPPGGGALGGLALLDGVRVEEAERAEGSPHRPVDVPRG